MDGCELLTVNALSVKSPYIAGRVRYVACIKHRTEAQRSGGQTEKQKLALSLGRVKGTNHLEGIPKSRQSNKKRSVSQKEWCAKNQDLVQARAMKIRGEQHYKWKGGISKLNQSIRRMTEYRKWAKSVRKRDGSCIECGATSDLEANHKIPLAELIELHCIRSREDARNCPQLWEESNGETMCESCHYKHHGRFIDKGRRNARKRKRLQKNAV